MNIEDLVGLSKDGCEEAKVELIKRLKPLIISSIERYYSIGEYEELFQEGILLILESIIEYNPKHRVKFLGFIKSKLKYHYLNKNKLEKEISLNEEDENGIELLNKIDSKIDIEDIIIEKYKIEYLYNLLNTLSKREKDIVYKYYIENKSLKEISNLLNIKYQTVANLKTIGINKLKKHGKKDENFLSIYRRWEYGNRIKRKYKT